MKGCPYVYEFGVLSPDALQRSIQQDFLVRQLRAVLALPSVHILFDLDLTREAFQCNRFFEIVAISQIFIANLRL